jgi:GntR family transcriptional regulator
MRSKSSLRALAFPEIHLDPTSPTPLYLQLAEGIREAILEGAWQPGEALPPERQMAEHLGISRITLRKALERLEEGGWLQRRQGSGTFVTHRIEQPLSTLSSFSEDMHSRGFRPGSRDLERKIHLPSPEEALALNLSPNSEVVSLVRVRLADEEPMALERSTLPRWALPELYFEGSLYAQLEAQGLRPTRALQRLRAVLLDPTAAQALALPPGAPALYIERISFLPNGRPIEFARSFYRADRYDFLVELRGGV